MKGSLSINSENIFPIIKKWLYSDHDIFIRELVSNATDAITKLKKLEMLGEAEISNPRIDVITNPKDKTIVIKDNGIGMTFDEVNKYINQIAFSGATAFLEKYKDKTDNDQIIGHFGLGFYSAFMVADKVTIDTLSYKEGEKAVFWTSNSGTEYEMIDSDKTEVGTTITLYLNDNSYEFSNEYRVREILNKYCAYMPQPIFYTHIDDSKNNDESKEEKEINDTTPIWMKNPSELKDEDYKDFYKKMFKDYKDPLFYIHLNMDYPFDLKGVLYFPKINTEYESIEGVINLYSNQVFIADNIKEVIPEFLVMLKGVIDCKDIPLNVSRSALQNDGSVKKIAEYISKKVADKLNGMKNTDRENYEKCYDDINPFIKYGCLKDDKFYEKIKKSLLYKNIENKYISLEEYLETAEEKEVSCECNGCDNDNCEKETECKCENEAKKIVYYVSDYENQVQYINNLKNDNIDALIFNTTIDNNFVGFLEMKNSVEFRRVDTYISKGEEIENSNELNEKLVTLFKEVLNKDIKVKVENMKNEEMASMMVYDETERRMEEMMKMYTNVSKKPEGTIVLNYGNKLVRYILEEDKNEKTNIIIEQLYDLARIGQVDFTGEELAEFIKRTNYVMTQII